MSGPPLKDTLRAPLPKRFYKDATVGEILASQRPSQRPPPSDDVGFPIHLDGRAIRTPGKRRLALPTRALAEAIAAEWAAQDKVINPATMPLTRFANTALDGVTGHEAEVAADILAFAGRDVLCYRAPDPWELAQRQAALWDPVLAWADTALGARLRVAEGVMPVDQPAETLAAIETALVDVPAFPLTALHVMTTLTGSAVLALAVSRGTIPVEDAWTAAHVDEDWQISQWGEDAEASSRRAGRWTEMVAAARFLELL